VATTLISLARPLPFSLSVFFFFFGWCVCWHWALGVTFSLIPDRFFAPLLVFLNCFSESDSAPSSSFKSTRTSWFHFAGSVPVFVVVFYMDLSSWFFVPELCLLEAAPCFFHPSRCLGYENSLALFGCLVILSGTFHFRGDVTSSL